MSSSSPVIGGYFELEIRAGSFPHQDAVLVNSGRNGFEYILKTHQVTKVYLPKFTCDVMLEPLERLGIAHEFYSITDQLEIAKSIVLNESELLLYTNYFGIKDTYCKELAQRYANKMIFDYSQAFFSEPIQTAHTFYSPRKFFGLPDGGMAYTDQALTEPLPTSTSYNHFSHLIKRIDVGAQAAYEDFKKNDAALSGLPLQEMSPLTRCLLGSIDYETAKKRRQENFAILHAVLGESNQLDLGITSEIVPMVYPYLIDKADLRQKLISSKIFVATYWPNVFEWCTEAEPEYYLAKMLLPLPIDQRYTSQDMRRILEVIHE